MVSASVMNYHRSNHVVGWCIGTLTGPGKMKLGRHWIASGEHASSMSGMCSNSALMAVLNSRRASVAPTQK